jgi:hypothetical protein
MFGIYFNSVSTVRAAVVANYIQLTHDSLKTIFHLIMLSYSLTIQLYRLFHLEARRILIYKALFANGASEKFHMIVKLVGIHDQRGYVLRGNPPKNEHPKAGGVTQRLLGMKARQDTHFVDPQQDLIRFPSVDRRAGF